MKYLLVLVPFVVFSTKAQTSVAQKSAKIEHHFPVDSLVSKWSSYSMEFEKKKRISKNTVTESFNQILYNVCPEIDFKADSTATIRPEGTNGAPSEIFLWGIKGNDLIISYPNQSGNTKKGNHHFSAGRYKVSVRNGGVLGLTKEVVLTDKGGMRYILIKSSE